MALIVTLLPECVESYDVLSSTITSRVYDSDEGLWPRKFINTVLVILGKYIMIIMGKCISVKGPMADVSLTNILHQKPSHYQPMVFEWQKCFMLLFWGKKFMVHISFCYFTKPLKVWSIFFSYSKFLFLMKVKPWVLPLWPSWHTIILQETACSPLLLW